MDERSFQKMLSVSRPHRLSIFSALTQIGSSRPESLRLARTKDLDRPRCPLLLDLNQPHVQHKVSPFRSVLNE